MSAKRHIRPAFAFSLGLILSLAIAGFMPLNVGEALAATVSCGDVITTDTTLDSDLANCPGDGLVIGADNVTLNLNGHSINHTHADVGTGVGIRSSHDGDQILNGCVGGYFGTGIELLGATNNLVSSVSSGWSCSNFPGAFMRTGIALRGANNNRLSGVDAAGYERDLVLTDSDSNVLEDISASDPFPTFESVPISLSGSSGNQLVKNYPLPETFIVDGSNGNTVTDNFLDGGVNVESSNDNRIIGNGAFYSDGAIVVDGVRNQVVDNYLHRGGYISIAGRNASVTGNSIDYGGIAVRASKSLIADNSIGSASVAIRDQGGVGNRIERNRGGRNFYGILEQDSQNTRVTDNVFRDGNGFSISGPSPGNRGIAVYGSFNTYVAGNTVSNNEDGIHVGADARKTHLGNNISTDNDDDGIDVESAQTVLIRNQANSNGDFGIESVPGVRAAGNSASGNGNPLQCLNVFCK